MYEGGRKNKEEDGVGDGKNTKEDTGETVEVSDVGFAGTVGLSW